MTDQGTWEAILKMAKEQGATDAVVIVFQSEESMVRFSNNEVTVVDRLNEKTAEIFVKVESRKASTNLTEFSEESIRSAVAKVVRAAANSPPGDVYEPLPEGPFTYQTSLLNKPPVPLDEKSTVDWVEAAIYGGLKEGAERMAGSLIAANSAITLLTTGNVFTEAHNSAIELSTRAFGKGKASGHSTSIASVLRDFNPEGTGEEAGRMAKLAANPSDGKAGEYQAVLAPLVFADIASQTGRLASAFYVDSGLSFLRDKIGDQVAARQFSITDDPTMAGTYGAAPFDAEGLPTQRTVIVDKGSLKTYLHNSTTARKFGTKSTANAGLVSPHPFNLVIDAGSETLESLIGSVEKGIYVTNDWYLRYQNYSTGDFSTIPRDAMFWIKNGQIDGSIKELRISDNILSILQKVESLSKERSWVKWWEVETPTLSPTALVSKVHFTRSQM